MAKSKTRRNQLSISGKTKIRRRKNRNVGGVIQDPIIALSTIATIYPYYYGIFENYKEGAIKIWQNLQNKNIRHCLLCKSPLPSEMEYISRSLIGRVGSGLTTKKTDKDTLIMRSYPLSTGNRFWTSPTLFLNVQPTIYYFHCHHCAYFYQFKGAIIKNRGNIMNRRSSNKVDTDETERRSNSAKVRSSRRSNSKYNALGSREKT